MTSLDAAFLGLPREAEGPVFREPWEAQTFALTLALHRAGVFPWSEWAAGDPDTGATYYRHWQATLERMIVAKGLSNARTIDRYSSAWAQAAHRTPHGTPIELAPKDF